MSFVLSLSWTTDSLTELYQKQNTRAEDFGTIASGQAKFYDDHRPFDEKARWIVTCNFDEIWIYDQTKPLDPVCGRMKSDYRYSAAIVYNNFPWPESDSEQHLQGCKFRHVRDADECGIICGEGG